MSSFIDENNSIFLSISTFLPHIYLVIQAYMYSFIYSFFHLLVLSFIHLFIHPSIHSFIYSLIHSFIHSLIHPFIHSFTHSLIHSFIHSPITRFWSQRRQRGSCSEVVELPKLVMFKLSEFVLSFVLFCYRRMRWLFRTRHCMEGWQDFMIWRNRQWWKSFLII